MTQTEKKAKILALLDKSDRAVERAIEVVYDRQTADEKSSKTTSHLNARGFSANDAEFGSSLGYKIKKGWTLSPKQIAAGRRMVKHYWKQLIEVADVKTPGWENTTTCSAPVKAPLPETVEVVPVKTQAEIDAEEAYWSKQEQVEEIRQEQKAFASDPDMRGMGF